MASTECLRNEPENDLALQNIAPESETKEPPEETDLDNWSEASTEKLFESFLDSIEGDTVDRRSHAGDEDLQGNESCFRKSANEGNEDVISGRKESMDKMSQTALENKTGFMPSDEFEIIDLENYRNSEAEMVAKTTDVEVVAIGHNESRFQSPDYNVEGMDVRNDASKFNSLDQKVDGLHIGYSEIRFKFLDDNVRDVDKGNTDSGYKLPDDNVCDADIGNNESRYELPDDNVQGTNIEYNYSRLSDYVESKGSQNNGPGFNLPEDDLEIDSGKNEIGSKSSSVHNEQLDNLQNQIAEEETVGRRPEEDTTTTADPSISKRTPASTSSSSNYKIVTLARTDFGADTTESNSPAKPKRFGVFRSKKRSVVTSTSQASRLRNLDPTSSDSSNQEKSSSNKMATTSSISDASKKRNLDQVSSSTMKESDASSSGMTSTSKTGKVHSYNRDITHLSPSLSLFLIVLLAG